MSSTAVLCGPSAVGQISLGSEQLAFILIWVMGLRRLNANNHFFLKEITLAHQ
jgi:hypothetical protein